MDPTRRTPLEARLQSARVNALSDEQVTFILQAAALQAYTTADEGGLWALHDLVAKWAITGEFECKHIAPKFVHLGSNGWLW